MTASDFAIGRPVRRKEDRRLLTGQGRYTDDNEVPGQLHGCVVRSPHGCADIRAIDTAQAAAAPGVVAVLTGADYRADGLGPIPHAPNPAHITEPGKPAFANIDGRPVFTTPHFPLASGRVRHVGDGVAFVVAETAAAAADAATMVTVDYTPLPAVTDARRAVAHGAPQLWADAPGNLCFDSELGDGAAVEDALAKAHRVVRLDLANNRVTAVAMEPRSAIAMFDAPSGKITLIAGSQGSHRIKDPLVALLGCAPDRVRVVCEDVGGGFGMRNWLFPELVLVVWAARRLGRPVKWVATRSESFAADMQARDLATRAALGVDADGRFVALDIDHLSNIGAYTMSFVPLANGVRLVTSVYDLPCAHVRARGVLTNTLPTGPYRGAGRPEAMYVIERLIDEAAAALGMDRAAIRRRNLIAPASLPYRNPMDVTYDCGAFGENMAAALDHAGWDGFAARRLKAADRGRLRGIGMANYVETPVGFPREHCEIAVTADSRVIVTLGTQSHGQGHETSFAQVVAELLGVPFDAITLVTGDTDIVPEGGGTHSNRSMRIAGTLMVRASDAIVAKARRLAAHLLEAAEDDISFADGRLRVTGTDRAFDLFEVAARAMSDDVPEDLRGALAATEKFAGRIPAYPTGCAVAEVEIDPDTGVVDLLRWTAVDDVGRVINPMIVEGQTHGGMAQGVGQALLEDIAYDDDSGQLRGGSFLDYAMPRADDLPSIDARTAENAVTDGNPLAVKGGGEGGTTPALGALMNAIVDALRPLGITELAMPATPERVWQAIRAAARCESG